MQCSPCLQAAFTRTLGEDAREAPSKASAHAGTTFAYSEIAVKHSSDCSPTLSTDSEAQAATASKSLQNATAPAAKFAAPGTGGSHIVESAPARIPAMCVPCPPRSFREGFLPTKLCVGERERQKQGTAREREGKCVNECTKVHCD
jgi:hypothetical protein